MTVLLPNGLCAGAERPGRLAAGTNSDGRITAAKDILLLRAARHGQPLCWFTPAIGWLFGSISLVGQKHPTGRSVSASPKIVADAWRMPK
jgi:hypothetical protein